jgi:hypothetical protein
MSESQNEVSTAKLQQAQLTHRSRSGIILCLVGGFSPSFGNVDVLRDRRVFLPCKNAEYRLRGLWWTHLRWLWSQNNLWEHKRHNYTTDWWILTVFFFISVSPWGCAVVPHWQRQKELWVQWWEHIWFLWQNTNSSEQKRQNYATSGWILTFFALRLFSKIVGLSPPVWSMEGQRALLGAMLGAHLIPDGCDGRTRQWWDVEILWRLEGVLDELVGVCCWDLSKCNKYKYKLT